MFDYFIVPSYLVYPYNTSTHKVKLTVGTVVYLPSNPEVLLTISRLPRSPSNDMYEVSWFDASLQMRTASLKIGSFYISSNVEVLTGDKDE